jgi:hypothetical protein
MLASLQNQIARCGLIALATSCLIPTAAHSEGGIFYEHKTWNYTPKIGTATPLGLHTIGFFDTTGSITAGLGNMTRQQSARMGKEQEMERKGEMTGTYSWEERQPVANDGEFYRIMWSSEGSPWGNVIPGLTAKTDYTPSLLGLEVDHTMWSHEGAPVSFGVGFGTYMYFMYLPGNKKNTNFSIPLTFTASAVPVENLTLYGNFAFGPFGYIKNQAKYDHLEGGVTYSLSEQFRLNASYRILNDYQNDGDLKDVSNKYKTTVLSVGAGWYF